MRFVRSVLRAIVIQALYWSGAFAWARRGLVRRRCVTVLLFHRVLTAEEQRHTNCLPAIVVSDGTFRGIMQYLRRYCEVVDLDTGMPRWKSESAKPRCAVTFDDGWIDNSSAALHIAQQYRIPFTIFICPGLMGARKPFWVEETVGLLRRLVRLRAGKRLPEALARSEIVQIWEQLSGPPERRLAEVIEHLKILTPVERNQMLGAFEAHLEYDGAPDSPVDRTMTWQDVERLRRAGVSFGLHTQTHQILTRISDAEVREELETSRAGFEEALGSECRLFAYPNGSCSHAVRLQVEAAGYRAAFTTAPLPWTAESDPLLIPRVNIWEKSAAGITGRFSRAALEYTLFWKPWRRLSKTAAPCAGGG